MTKIRKFYPALLNGHKVTAEKRGHHWMVGGDYDLSGSISIMMANKKFEGYSWFSLKGCFLRHEANCLDQEVTEMQAFLNDYLADKNDPECEAA